MRAVWAALHDYRGGEDGTTGGADFADALILATSRQFAREGEQPFDGLYTFDAKARRMPGTKAP